jgi:predicted transcriptional regulator
MEQPAPTTARERAIIFLDIDGVLNRTVSATHIRLDDDLVAKLRVLAERSGAAIVLSTYWREFGDYIAYILSRHKILSPVIGRTPGRASSRVEGEKRYDSRSDEIRAWLAANRKEGFSHFVVLDDREDAGLSIEAHLVLTESEVGLTDEHVARALRILEAAPHGAAPGIGPSAGCAADQAKAVTLNRRSSRRSVDADDAARAPMSVQV